MLDKHFVIRNHSSKRRKNVYGDGERQKKVFDTKHVNEIDKHDTDKPDKTLINFPCFPNLEVTNYNSDIHKSPTGKYRKHNFLQTLTYIVAFIFIHNLFCNIESVCNFFFIPFFFVQLFFLSGGSEGAGGIQFRYIDICTLPTR